MKERWVDTMVERQRSWNAQGERAPAQARGATWGIRVRGDTSGLISHEYECPVHGRFEALVPRAGVPDDVCCPHPTDNREVDACGKSARWCPPLVGVGKSAGEVAC